MDVRKCDKVYILVYLQVTEESNLWLLRWNNQIYQTTLYGITNEVIDSWTNAKVTRNSSGNEIANVNFIYDDIVLVLAYIIQ